MLDDRDFVLRRLVLSAHFDFLEALAVNTGQVRVWRISGRRLRVVGIATHTRNLSTNLVMGDVLYSQNVLATDAGIAGDVSIFDKADIGVAIVASELLGGWHLTDVPNFFPVGVVLPRDCDSLKVRVYAPAPAGTAQGPWITINVFVDELGERDRELGADAGPRREVI